MSIRLRGLQAGDILLGRDSGVYVYLGTYIQRNKPQDKQTEGYLYCYIGQFNSEAVERALSNELFALDRVCRVAIASFTIKNFGKFTKNPITFDKRVGHIDVAQIPEYIDNIYALKLERIAISKLRGEKFKA